MSNKSDCDILEWVLPRPPSMNALWRGGKGRVYLSKPYKTWIEKASPIVPRYQEAPFPDWYKLSIFLSALDKRGDIDNYSKAISDFLELQNVIVNDSMCMRLLIEKSVDVPKGFAFVIVEQFLK